MDDRRAVLLKAAKIAGVALTAPLLSASAPYVRLAEDRGMETDEIDRFHSELDLISTTEALLPPKESLALVAATWANIDSSFMATNTKVAELKARTALLGGVVSIPLLDSQNGLKWFGRAQSYARIYGDSELISTVYYNEGVGRLFWKDRLQSVYIQAALASKHAQTPVSKGRAAALLSSYHSRSGEKMATLRAAQTAIHHANGGGEANWNSWTEPQAHGYVARSLSRFGELAPNVEESTGIALKGIPGYYRLRANTRLSLSDAYLSAGEFEGAYAEMDRTLKVLPAVHRNASLVSRILDSIDLADLKGGGGRFVPIREFLLSEHGDPRTAV